MPVSREEGVRLRWRVWPSVSQSDQLVGSGGARESSLSLLVFNLPVLPVSGAGVEISAQGHESACSLFLCLLPALGSSAAGRYTHTSEGARHKRAGPFVVMKPLPGSPTHLRLMSLSCDVIVCKLAFLWSVLPWHLLPPAHFPSCLCLRLASVCLSAFCACGGLGSDCEITSPLRSKTKM